MTTPPDPRAALLVFAALCAVLAFLVWPRYGLVPRVVRLLRMTERIRLEDALKHLYHSEQVGRISTIESVAGALEIGRGHALRVVERLGELDLAQSDAGAVALTPAGRRYALRIIRTHRLWERYLADRTGVAPAEWHDQAERQEHALSPREAEALASRMGNPPYDPHGDPIPSATGELPARSGEPLTALSPGTAAAIVHLEDEPREVFERLLGEGLMPGVELRLLEAGSREVRFRMEGREHTLPAVVAGNITVERRPGAEVTGEVHRTLADLAPGEAGRVIRIAPSCQGPQRRRLLDLGVVPGTVVTAEFSSAGGDPVAYRIRGALIALRRSQAAQVQIEPAALAAAS